MRTLFTVLLLFSLTVPALTVPAMAEPAISCHCFRERDYDPARPAAVDPYLLATARNSLLAAAFDIDKKDIVKARMTGTSAADLWVAHYAAAASGRPAAGLLAARGDAGSWAAVLRSLDRKVFAPRFAGAVAAGEGDTLLATVAVDETLLSRLAVPPAELAALRAGGASDQETVLAAVVARVHGRPAPALLEAARSGTSWGTLLDRAGLAPAAVEEAIRRLLR